jgi:hypothetical protein
MKTMRTQLVIDLKTKTKDLKLTFRKLKFKKIHRQNFLLWTNMTTTNFWIYSTTSFSAYPKFLSLNEK